MNGDSKPIGNSNQDIGYILPDGDNYELGVVAMDYEYYQTRIDGQDAQVSQGLSKSFSVARA